MEIDQIAGTFAVRLDGKAMFSERQTDSKEYRNVKIYAGLSRQDPVASGTIRHLIYLKL